MKQFKLTGALLKSLALVGLLTACNNDQAINPTEKARVALGDQNAKSSPSIRIVKDGENTIQYVKSGKFTGKISRIDRPSRYILYAYDDSNPAGTLWITATTYNKNTNAFEQEEKYQVVNGRCISNTTKLDNGVTETHEYKYNAQGLLEEIKKTSGSPYTLTLTHQYVAATQSYRLNKILYSHPGGPQYEWTYSYGNTPNKYSLNLDDFFLDKYLPYFGTFGDVLVDRIDEYQFAFPNAGKSYNKFKYLIDGDGYVSTRIKEQRHTKTNGTDELLSSSTITQKYSANWQGI